MDTLSADAAEWIREHAWTGRMREIFREVPGFYLACACEYGITHGCSVGKHSKCHRSTALPSSETVICASGGHVRAFRKPFRHKSRTSATGPRKTSAADVWHADRVCRWLCPCGCHMAGKQLDLFSAVPRG